MVEVFVSSIAAEVDTLRSETQGPLRIARSVREAIIALALHAALQSINRTSGELHYTLALKEGGVIGRKVSVETRF